MFLIDKCVRLHRFQILFLRWLDFVIVRTRVVLHWFHIELAFFFSFSRLLLLEDTSLTWAWLSRWASPRDHIIIVWIFAPLFWKTKSLMMRFRQVLTHLCISFFLKLPILLAQIWLAALAEIAKTRSTALLLDGSFSQGWFFAFRLFLHFEPNFSISVTHINPLSGSQIKWAVGAMSWHVTCTSVIKALRVFIFEHLRSCTRNVKDSL